MNTVEELKGHNEPMSQEEFEKRMELEGDAKTKKYIALYQARLVLSKIGTIPERRLVKKQLKIMKRDGLNSV